MGDVIQLKPRVPADQPKGLEALDHLSGFRTNAGGDASNDHTWNGRINDALKQLLVVPLKTYSVHVPELTEAQRDSLIEQMEQVISQQRIEHLNAAAAVIGDAMTSIILELTGGHLPVSWPFHHKK